MDKFAITAIVTALMFSVPVFADVAHHPEKVVGANSAPVPLAPQVKTMQDNVQRMSAQLDRIAKAKTDEARHKAMAEHMQSMMENMKMAHEMKAGMMEGGMAGKGGMAAMHGGKMGGGAGPDDASGRMQQMEKRLDMMQMMRRQEGAAATAPMPMK